MLINPIKQTINRSPVDFVAILCYKKSIFIFLTFKDYKEQK